MESNRHVFLRMTEEFYMDIPEEIRAVFLRDKRVDEEQGDWTENMLDPVFSDLHDKSKKAKEDLRERQYQLREERRAVKKIEVFDPTTISNEDF